MSVKYNGVELKCSSDSTASAKFYVNAKANEDISLKSLAQEISEAL